MGANIFFCCAQSLPIPTSTLIKHFNALFGVGRLSPKIIISVFNCFLLSFFAKSNSALLHRLIWLHAWTQAEVRSQDIGPRSFQLDLRPPISFFDFLWIGGSNNCYIFSEDANIFSGNFLTAPRRSPCWNGSQRHNGRVLIDQWPWLDILFQQIHLRTVSNGRGHILSTYFTSHLHILYKQDGFSQIKTLLTKKIGKLFATSVYLQHMLPCDW